MPSSKYLYEDYKKYLKDIKVEVKYIPLTIDSIHDKNKLDNKNIISVGRLSKEKGFDDLIEIMKLVRLKDENIKLTICGDGPERKQLQELIDNDNSIRKTVSITGFLNYDDLKKQYENSSLYVMTSHEESFGLVLIEAMSYGIPCFAFDSALGACEIINNKNGRLVKNRNKEEMAKLICNYFYNKEKYDTRSTIDKYYIENVEKEWKKFVNDIIM
jgi:N-acetylglucosaminyldiphosphoundecaprenol N-acetyl-beta-D-mannosaminyltransferase